jgi:hypothetical protein
MTTSTVESSFLFIFRRPVDMTDPSPEEMQKNFQKWRDWIEGLKAKGISSGGLPLEEEGSVLRGPRGVKITDGPFVEGKEVVGGYIIVNARDLAAAAEIASGCPGLAGVHSVEVRPVAAM